ncbi:hypothetical protein SCUCBS95973_002338 [Sporothrix curviconia]|uniref:Uncharacterized protein n=1 Tax=Sporothrix curviconia TaxID=1260050 RepID=A0ABP0B655_9PEZI
MREALVECFQALTALVRPEIRCQLVLKTEDLDVAAPPEPLLEIFEVVMAGAPGFSIGPDGSITMEASLGFEVNIDLIQLGAGSIGCIYESKPYFEGALASKADLLRLRAVTVACRAEDGDVLDLKWLLAAVMLEEQLLPRLAEEDLESVVEAGERALPPVWRLVLAAALGEENHRGVSRLLLL